MDSSCAVAKACFNEFNSPVENWMVANVTSRADVVELVLKFLNTCASAPAQSADQGKREGSLLEECSRMISIVYRKAADIDVLNLSPENRLKYQLCMDTCRMMQSIIDQDNGEGSPQAQRACQALKASLLGK
jgi:hypothetical protein